MASVVARRKPESTPERPATLADLLRRLGNIPARRVRLEPAPGTATERDVLLTAPREIVTLGIGDVLNGGNVLPGFRLPVRDVFELGE